jgi:beta-glucosidase
MEEAPRIIDALPEGSPEHTLRYPAGFLWGISTAAHQVEGGNGNNQWSAWESAGRIKSGERSGLACNWWVDAEQDFDLAAKLGVNALRLSIEWSRIEPRPGQWDGTALKRYRQLLDGLRSRGIQPMVCLHHFTHPRWFEEEGAFLAPHAGERFEHFSRRIVNEVGDLCRHWVTINEPNVFAALGYFLGEFPPGRAGDIGTSMRVVRAMAECHARAYRAIHELQPEAQVGWAHNYAVFTPLRDSFAPDRWITWLLSQLFNESFFTLIEHGRPSFPLSLLNGNLTHVKGSCDFVGLNVYSRFHVEFSLRHYAQLFGNVFVPDHVPQGDRGAEKPYGEAYPGAIPVAVRRAARLGKPIYILENGVPDAEDRIRPWLIANAARELHKLIGEGYDVRGYFHWTLTDNFEWSEGWHLKFGLVELNRLTQERTVRRSGNLFAAIARANAISSKILERYDAGPDQK